MVECPYKCTCVLYGWVAVLIPPVWSVLGGRLFLGEVISRRRAAAVGLALGGAVGGALAAVWAGDKFRPLHEVITHEMSQHQRDRMVECLRNVLTNIGS